MDPQSIDDVIVAYTALVRSADDRDELDAALTLINRLRSGLEMVIAEANDLRQALPVGARH